LLKQRKRTHELKTRIRWIKAEIKKLFNVLSFFSFKFQKLDDKKNVNNIKTKSMATINRFEDLEIWKEAETSKEIHLISTETELKMTIDLRTK
jgi:hypothetical protein